MGWLATAETMRMMSGKAMDQTLPGLERFYMAGQWVVPAGGLPTAATSGRNLVQSLCKEDKRLFVTTVP